MDGTDRHRGRAPHFPPRERALHPHRRCTPTGFSLIELLVVIGIIALLVTILVPVLARTRAAARKVVCAGRLRELTLASRMYHDENKMFPEPLQEGALDPLGQFVLGHAPHQVSTRLLNELRPYLKFPEVDAQTDVSRLPPFVQCPFAEEHETDRGPTVSFFDASVATYYTGYAYLARLDEKPSMPAESLSMLITMAAPVIDQGQMLRPNRAASARDKRRAVLWADHVSRSDRSGGFWQYTHARSGKPGPLPLTRHDPYGLVGQHRAYTDASVEWVGARELKVDGQQPDKTASFKTASEHWWF